MQSQKSTIRCQTPWETNCDKNSSQGVYEKTFFHHGWSIKKEYLREKLLCMASNLDSSLGTNMLFNSSPCPTMHLQCFQKLMMFFFGPSFSLFCDSIGFSNLCGEFISWRRDLVNRKSDRRGLGFALFGIMYTIALNNLLACEGFSSFALRNRYGRKRSHEMHDRVKPLNSALRNEGKTNKIPLTWTVDKILTSTYCFL